MNFELVFTAFVAALYGNIFVRALAVAICADMVFGSLRAMKERHWNSAVGIDGGIRKVGMVSAILLLTALDMVLGINVIGWVGDSLIEALSKIGVVKLGVTELFALLFVLYEFTSVLKNMLLCDIPIPAGVKKRLEKWMNDMTDESGDAFKDLENAT